MDGNTACRRESFTGHSPSEPDRLDNYEKHSDVISLSSREQPRNAPKIAALDLSSNSFTGRVAFKSNVMPFKDSGERFCLDFVDETGRIYAVIFYGEDSDLFEKLQEQKIYDINNFKVKEVNEYSTTGHQYELILSSSTKVDELKDDPNIPRYRFTFRTIPEVQTTETGSRVDIIAICNEVKEVEYPLVDGEPMARLDVQFVDSLGNQIIVTFWDIQAEDIDEEIVLGNVVAIRGAKVKDYYEPRNLSFGKNAFKLMLGDISEASAFLATLGLSAGSFNLNVS